jgi:hypothetical protein
VLRALRRIALTLVAALAATYVGLFSWITQPLAGFGVQADTTPAADPARLRRTVDFLTARPQRDASHPEVLREVADDIAASFTSFGLPTIRRPYQVHGVLYENVEAVAGPAAGREIVIGAHYDVYGDSGPNPGADDNASGVAGLVELARLLAESPPTVRVVLIAYSTEEPPYFASPGMGSAVDADLRKHAQPRSMLSLEMIGYYTERQPWSSHLLGLFYPRQGDFVAVVGRHQDRDWIAAWKRGLSTVEDLRVRSYAGPWMEELGFSDQRNYWAIGIPAAMVTDTAFLRNPNYHTDADRADTLDYARMAKIVDGLARTVRGPLPTSPLP